MQHRALCIFLNPSYPEIKTEELVADSGQVRATVVVLILYGLKTQGNEDYGHLEGSMAPQTSIGLGS